MNWLVILAIVIYVLLSAAASRPRRDRRHSRPLFGPGDPTTERTLRELQRRRQERSRPPEPLRAEPREVAEPERKAMPERPSPPEMPAPPRIVRKAARPSPVREEPALEPPARRVLSLLRAEEGVAVAFLLSEVLRPPRALRPWRPGRD